MKVLIVDDEPLVRHGIKVFLEREKDIEVIAECENGLEAVIAINEMDPDLVFLDVQMPELNGFGVIESLNHSKMPLIVFVTAYDRYALRAFEVHAIDYLLKPFDAERFQETLRHARQQFQLSNTEQINEGLRNLITQLNPSKNFLDRIVVKSHGRIFFLPVDNINWIKSADNYLSLFSERKEYLIRETLQNIEKKLDPRKFLRIRHSTIVNVNSIKEFQPFGNGEFMLYMIDGTKLIASRSYRQRILNFLEN